jgi:hypothetical protein
MQSHLYNKSDCCTLLKLNAIKSTGKSICDARCLDDPVGNERGVFCSASLLTVGKYSLRLSRTI